MTDNRELEDVAVKTSSMISTSEVDTVKSSSAMKWRLCLMTIGLVLTVFMVSRNPCFPSAEELTRYVCRYLLTGP